MRSFFSRACTFLALGLIVFGGLLPAAAVHAQQTPIRAPAQRGIGAQERGVTDYISGLAGAAYSRVTGEPMSENAENA